MRGRRGDYQAETDREFLKEQAPVIAFWPAYLVP